MELELQIKAAVDNVAEIKSKLNKFGEEAAEGKRAIAALEAKLASVDNEAKLQELLAPVNDKAQKAIEAVAKEKGYSYIMDTSVGGIIYALPGDNIIDAVKVKLNIKEVQEATTPAAPKKK